MMRTQLKWHPKRDPLCPLCISVYICPRKSPTKHAMPIYDITVPIRSGMPIYEGDPGIDIQTWSALAKGDSANVSFLHFGAHTGTHVDAPAHFIEGARKIDALSLETLIGPARVIQVPDNVNEIGLDFLAGCDLDQVERVLFHTRNSSFWNEGFRKDFTHLSPRGRSETCRPGSEAGRDRLPLD